MTNDNEIKEYESHYSDILWIDDMDESQGSLYNRNTKDRHQKQKIDFLKIWMPDSYLYIDLIKDMSEAISIITENCSKYNLVIFDMDMNKGFKDHQKIREDFGKYHIMCTDEKDKSDKDVMTKIAGVYLYLLLLTMGYPADRMIIYTGNLNEDLDKYLKKYSNILVFNENIIIEKDQEHKIDIETYYQEVNNKTKNSYYRIRRLVQQGCHYWKNKLEGIRSSAENEKNIPFNKLYFSGNNNNINRISTENFLELLDRVEMMFPVVPPENPDKVYYQAARILSEYHENSADIKKLNNYEDLYTFHLVCRSFRNWSSHNKFTKAEMSAKIFAVIFCIALRTYFDEKQNEDRHYVPELKYYEEIYFSKKDISEKEYNNVCETIKNKLTENISLVKFFSSTKQDIQKNQGNQKYSHLVYIWGEENNKADVQDVLMPIIVKDKNIPIANNKLQELKVCSLLSANNFSAVNEQSEEEISGTQCIQEGISTDNEQSDEITFIDLIVRSSIELWLEKSAENKQEASS